MRHAETESGASYADDSLRPLTENGRNTQRLVGQNMSKLNIRPAVVLCSPRLRAQQTAEITVEGLDVDVAVEVVQVLDGGNSVEQLIGQLSKYSTESAIMCVGHVPDMGIWMEAFLGENSCSEKKFKTSSFAHLVFEDESKVGSGKLKGFYRADLPSQ